MLGLDVTGLFCLGVVIVSSFIDLNELSKVIGVFVVFRFELKLSSSLSFKKQDD